MSLPESWRPATVAVHAGRPEQIADAPLNTPITMASTFVAGGEREYGRHGNPNWSAFEDALGALEGGRALAFASGLAVVAAVLDLVGQDQKVVVPRHAYNGTIMQLADREARGRLKVELVDITDTAAVVTACQGASLVWLESPTNPALEVVDLGPVVAAAHASGGHVVMDNTFATPLLAQPLDDEVDVVVHSATKYISGHSDVLMGAAVTRDDELYAALKTRRELTGAIPSPFDAYLALRGLRTLPLRMERAQRNAAELADRLRSHPNVASVRYPGFGAIIALVLPNQVRAELLERDTRLWVHATSLGGVESTLERRRRWRAEPISIPAELVRLSVGIEDVEDLYDDLAQALDGASHPLLDES